METINKSLGADLPIHTQEVPVVRTSTIVLREVCPATRPATCPERSRLSTLHKSRLSYSFRKVFRTFLSGSAWLSGHALPHSCPPGLVGLPLF